LVFIAYNKQKTKQTHMKKSIFLIAILFVLFSCSSNDSNDDSNPSTGGILLKRIETPGSQPYHYNYNGNKLNYVALGSTDGSLGKIQFTYSGDLITKWEYYELNQPTGYGETFSYANNKLVQKKIYSDGLVLEVTYDYVYNSDGTVNETETDANNPLVITKYYFDSNGNIIKSVEGSTETIYEYDNKNLPYKNITGFNKIVPFSEASGQNNATKIIGGNNITIINYEYNSQNYPISKESINSEGDTEIENYFYY
ncbi:MAG: hypothetical protein WD512_07510, partial [Candidatus Paceibacterota bacterium]